MAGQEQESILNVASLSANLLAEQEVAPRARTFAQFVAELLTQPAVTVYTLGSDGKASYWIPKATVGDAKVHDQAIPKNAGFLGVLAANQAPILRTPEQLAREDYSHVDIRKTLACLCYLPLVHGEQLIGALEILSFEDELTEESLATLSPAASVAAAAIASAQAYEEERHGTLTSITRLTQLYDLEKVFSSTLEMDELLPLMDSQFSEILACQAVNIWLLLPDETVELLHQAGEDPTAFKGQILKPGEGVAGALSDNGETACIADPCDGRLIQRNQAVGEVFVRSLIAAPIMDRSALVGVVEAVNKLDGSLFDDDDLFTLTSLTDTASTALHNASLLMAERKVEILETPKTRPTSTARQDRYRTFARK